MCKIHTHFAFQDDENADLLKSMVKVPVTLAEVAQWTMVGVGAALMIVSGFFLVRIFCLKRSSNYE